MAAERKKFSNVEQLRNLLKLYPDVPVDIHGTILDYLGQTGESLYDVLEFNPAIYRTLFMGERAAEGRQLLTCLQQSKEEANALGERCRQIYPNIAEYLSGMKIMPTGAAYSCANAGGLLSAPAECLRRPVRTVVWQLSDIHFGKFNRLEQNPRELAFQVARICVDYPSIKPDLLIISGDATSVAAEEEFERFCSFCQHLGDAIWKPHQPERMLVVPGNHDVTWQTDGTADHMERFVSCVAARKVCVTPFGAPEEHLAGDRVLVRRFDPNPKTVPPFATVIFREHDLEVILLVSAYFSGEVPQEVRSILAREGVSDADLKNLLRVDEGALNREYLFNIASIPERQASLRMAVTHHNPIGYGTEVCANKFASQFLETLYQHGVPLVLHGHCHLVEDQRSFRPLARAMSYPLPCTTLAADPTAGGRGMSIHFIGQADCSTVVDTAVWELSQTSAFKEDGLTLRYRLTMNDDGMSVRHL